ncbi:MAG: hypothetical protein Q7J28_15575 [Caulobacter sp.]|nr:hypothetical protein [Caulobacter sp.]
MTPAQAGAAGDDALSPQLLAVIEALAAADARRDYAAALEGAKERS